MFCSNCGTPQTNNEKFCPQCGTPYGNISTNVANGAQNPYQINVVQTYATYDNPSCLVNILCFMFPLLGLILYIFKHDTSPKCAKSYLTSAAMSVLLGGLFIVLVYIGATAEA